MGLTPRICNTNSVLIYGTTHARELCCNPPPPPPPPPRQHPLPPAQRPPVSAPPHQVPRGISPAPLPSPSLASPGPLSFAEMSADSIQTVAVLGAGTMGNGIAHVFARSGYRVILRDLDQGFLHLALATISKNL